MNNVGCARLSRGTDTVQVYILRLNIMLPSFSPKITSDKKSMVILTEAHERQTERRAWFHERENAPATAEVGRRKVALMTLLIGNAGCVKLHDNHPTCDPFFWCTIYGRNLENRFVTAGVTTGTGGAPPRPVWPPSPEGLSHFYTLSHRVVYSSWA